MHCKGRDATRVDVHGDWVEIRLAVPFTALQLQVIASEVHQHIKMEPPKTQSARQGAIPFWHCFAIVHRRKETIRVDCYDRSSHLSASLMAAWIDLI